jgi:choline dehydrogenase-like flavoprotein
MIYDAVIVGAGISGSFIANALVQAGLECVMLEAGGDFTRAAYPRAEVDANSLLYRGGGIELTKDANIGLLRRG